MKSGQIAKVRGVMADSLSVLIHGDAHDHASPLGELRERLVTELRDRLLEQALSLPLGNQLALARVAGLCRKPDASANAIADEAALDEGFTATLLRVANSAALGTASRIEDLPTAIARLGFRFVECLAVAAPSLRLLAAPSDGLEQARRDLHRHSVRVGVAARALAPAGIEPDRALAAGLVHNLGLSVLSLHARSGFRKLVESASQGEQLAEVESRLFGFTHAEIGAMLGESWSYPESLVTAIREHDAALPSAPLPALIQVADLLVRASGFGIEPIAEPSPAVAALAGVEIDRARIRVELLLEAGDARTDDQCTADVALAEVLDTLV
jgi:HD-like signal output (HDOD) protein